MRRWRFTKGLVPLPSRILPADYVASAAGMDSPEVTLVRQYATDDDEPRFESRGEQDASRRRGGGGALCNSEWIPLEKVPDKLYYVSLMIKGSSLITWIRKANTLSELLTLKQAPPQRNFNFSRRVDETSNLEVEKVTSTFLITSRRRRTL